MAAFRRLLDVDAGVAQPLEVILLVLIREHGKGTLAAVDAIADERQQRVVLLTAELKESVGSSNSCQPPRSIALFQRLGRYLSLFQAVRDLDGKPIEWRRIELALHTRFVKVRR